MTNLNVPQKFNKLIRSLPVRNSRRFVAAINFYIVAHLFSSRISSIY